MKIAILILARGGSRGVLRKNVRLLKGRPLISYVIEQAKKLPYPIYVSTEDSEIKDVALGLGVQVIDRPLKLALDDSRSIDAIKHAQRVINADYIVLLNACCPLLLFQDIENCVKIALETGCDSVTSLVEDSSAHPSKVCNLIEGKIYPINTSYSFQTGERQKLAPIFKRNTAIYVISKRNIRKGLIFDKNIRGYVMPESRSIDINSEFQLKLCELL